MRCSMCVLVVSQLAHGFGCRMVAAIRVIRRRRANVNRDRNRSDSGNDANMKIIDSGVKRSASHNDWLAAVVMVLHLDVSPALCEAMGAGLHTAVAGKRFVHHSYMS